MSRHSGRIIRLLSLFLVASLCVAGLPTQVGSSEPDGLVSGRPSLRLNESSRPGGAIPRESPAADSGVPAGDVAYTYEYVPFSIEPVGGRADSRAYGVNATGQVAARSSNYDAIQDKAVDRQAFVWDPVEGYQALPTLDGESGVWDINDDGFVSGYSFTAGGMQHAVRWDITQDPIAVTDLGTLSNPTTAQSGDTSTAYGLSPLGEVTGYSDIPNNTDTFTAFHAFLYTETGGMQDLETLSTSYPDYMNGYSISYDANGSGTVVGLAHSTDGGWHFRPFVYDAAGGMRELARAAAYATPAYEWYASAINESGLIGGHVIAATDQSLPYYWTDETAVPLPLPMPAAFPNGEIYGINGSGVMVGIMWNAAQEERAFVYDAVGGVRDLNVLVDAAVGWTLEFARDINDDGQIVGSGTLGGLARGFLLTPADLALGRISGAVRHNVTGVPLAGVQIDLYDDAGTLADQAQTDPTGSYETGLLFPGEYYAVANNTLGPVNQLFDGYLCTGCDPTAGTAISVEAGLVTTSIDFALGPTMLTSEDVVWTRRVDAFASGNDLTKTGPVGWRAGAVSTKGILSGDGYVEFTVPAAPQLLMAGLNRDDDDVSYQDIDYAVYAYGDGSVHVYESGTYRGRFGSYTSGDRFRVGVEDGVVTYRRNGEMFYESTVPVTLGDYPLLLDTALFSAGASLADATIAGTLVDVWAPPVLTSEDVVWTRDVGVVVSGNDLVKTAPFGWNAGAVSTKGILSGDGYVEFTVPAAPQLLMAGLSRDDDDVSYQDIDYAVYAYGDGSVYVYESGTYRGRFGSYTSGDRFRVGVEDGVVTYRRNGEVFYESTVPVTLGGYPLLLDTALFSAGASLADATIAGTLVDVWAPPMLTSEDVVWTRRVDVFASGNDLTKTGPVGWRAGAVSTKGILSGDGYVEFTVPAAPQLLMAGLNRDDDDVSYQDIDYAVYAYGDGSVHVYESGTYRGRFGSYTSGDRFRVGVEDGVVTYRRNGEMFYESTVPVTLGDYPLLLDTALFSAGASLADATIAGTLVDVWAPPVLTSEDVVWTRDVGVVVSGNDLVKTAPFGWNAGAVSTKGILSGDGYVEFTVPAAPQLLMAGLSRDDDDVSYQDIDYAVYAYGDGSVYVYESGTYRGRFGSYTSGDRFRVGVEDGVVTYRRNGDVFYESTVPVTSGSYPLLLDTALYSTGATLTDATIAGTLPVCQ